MPALELATIYSSNSRDIVTTLRLIADQIESGHYGDVDQVVLVVHGENVEVFGLGDTTGTGAHLLLACAQRKLENGVLFP